MLPFRELVEHSQEVDAACHISPAENRNITNLRKTHDSRLSMRNPNLKGLCCQLRLFSNYTARKVQKSNVVLAANVSHDVLVEEFENKRDTVGEYQMLGHELKLINVVDLEVFQEEEEDGRHSFHNDFFVSVNINSKLHRLHHCHWHLFRQHICHDIDGVCLGLAGGSSSKKNLKESNHILWQWWQHGLVQHLLAK